MRPKTGGRVELDRVSAPGDSPIVYHATLFLPDGEHEGKATIDAAGTVEFGDWAPGGVPGWLLEYARQFLRGEWRARQAPDAAPWPQRISRWRAPPSSPD